ncbi:MAG TPA: hypothetical protein VMU19_04545 [Bryobacteraceae bacterium]|nr:hypothetical protein [Bryobacteraceae bacterium]
MKQEAAFFVNREPVLLYIAQKLKDALRLEAILDSAGVDYGVEPDEYRGGVIFRTVRVGAFFYVRAEHAEAAREVLRRNNYTPAEPEPQAPEALAP